MNNTFSLEQISKTGNLNADLILRQYKLDIMARFMQRKSEQTKTYTRTNIQGTRIFRFNS